MYDDDDEDDTLHTDDDDVDDQTETDFFPFTLRYPPTLFVFAFYSNAENIISNMTNVARAIR